MNKIIEDECIYSVTILLLSMQLFIILIKICFFNFKHYFLNKNDVSSASLDFSHYYND